MTTFPNDMVRLHLAVGTQVLPLQAVGLEWPPPERLTLDGLRLRETVEGDNPEAVLVRLSCSVISDEDREHMEHVFRGAEYRYEVEA